jgi:glycosyltransferase involved in cell wall biosynthesis
LVVDDGSTDRTAEMAVAAGVRVIRHPINSGYGRALITGLEAARYDTVAITDADGTYPIELLPQLLSFYDLGFQMAVAARQGRHYDSSLRKKMLRLFFRVLAEFTCGRKIPDINSGFRVFYRRPVLVWRSAVSSGFSFTTTITFLFMLNNLMVGYLPVKYHKRVGKSKVRLVRDSLRSLQIIFTAIAQFNPLKLYILLLIANMVGSGTLVIFLNKGWMPALPVWCLIISWNTVCLITALAILTLAVLKPVPSTSQH